MAQKTKLRYKRPATLRQSNRLRLRRALDGTIDNEFLSALEEWQKRTNTKSSGSVIGFNGKELAELLLVRNGIIHFSGHGPASPQVENKISADPYDISESVEVQPTNPSDDYPAYLPKFCRVFFDEALNDMIAASVEEHVREGVPFDGELISAGKVWQLRIQAAWAGLMDKLEKLLPPFIRHFTQH